MLLINGKLAKAINKLQFLKTKIALISTSKLYEQQATEEQKTAQGISGESESNNVRWADDADARVDYVLEMAKASKQHSAAALIQMLNMENRKITESLKLKFNHLVDNRRKT